MPLDDCSLKLVGITGYVCKRLVMPVGLGYFPSIFALTASQNGERVGSIASPVPCLFLLPSLFSSHLLPFFSQCDFPKAKTGGAGLAGSISVSFAPKWFKSEGHPQSLPSSALSPLRPVLLTGPLSPSFPECLILLWLESVEWSIVIQEIVGQDTVNIHPGLLSREGGWLPLGAEGSVGLH